jgi:hypothetical protein
MDARTSGDRMIDLRPHQEREQLRIQSRNGTIQTNNGQAVSENSGVGTDEETPIRTRFSRPGAGAVGQRIELTAEFWPFPNYSLSEFYQ